MQKLTCNNLDVEYSSPPQKAWIRNKKSLIYVISHGSQASTCFEIIHTNVWGVGYVISHA